MYTFRLVSIATVLVSLFALVTYGVVADLAPNQQSSDFERPLLVERDEYYTLELVGNGIGSATVSSNNIPFVNDFEHSSNFQARFSIPFLFDQQRNTVSVSAEAFGSVSGRVLRGEDHICDFKLVESDAPNGCSFVADAAYEFLDVKDQKIADRCADDIHIEELLLNLDSNQRLWAERFFRLKNFTSCESPKQILQVLGSIDEIAQFHGAPSVDNRLHSVFGAEKAIQVLLNHTDENAREQDGENSEEPAGTFAVLQLKDGENYYILKTLTKREALVLLQTTR